MPLMLVPVLVTRTFTSCGLAWLLTPASPAADAGAVGSFCVFGLLLLWVQGFSDREENHSAVHVLQVRHLFRA